MGKAKGGKPKGKTSSYAFFVQTCREEHKKKHPGEQVDFSEFSKKCSEKWKAMNAKEKKRFEEMAQKDKVRYDSEVANSSGGKPAGRGGKRKRTKDPNAPKRYLSAFFYFCNEERPKVKVEMPGQPVADIAKELGKRWEACTNRGKFESLASKDKARYEQEVAAYKSGGEAKKARTSASRTKENDDDDDDKDDDDKDDDDVEDEEEEEDESD